MSSRGCGWDARRAGTWGCPASSPGARLAGAVWGTPSAGGVTTGDTPQGGGSGALRLPAVSTEAASCPFFLAVTNLPLDARSVIRRSRHSMSK